MNPPALAISGLAKHFDKPAVRDLSLTIRPGRAAEDAALEETPCSAPMVPARRRH